MVCGRPADPAVMTAFEGHGQCALNAERAAATGASRAWAAHVIALRPVGRRDEFADGGGIADKVRQEVHFTCPCPYFGCPFRIAGIIASRRE
ncbi:hypothetical protein MESS4_160041 [Mesorhizobium sp. STM 4661]|nr:hypothetical protein MESS4_160041 [Mesorhizobium sp. STM 4661]